jgi:hypothetical protein
MTATETPFFSAGLLVTAPNGTYGGLRRSKVFQAYDDRIEIDRMKIYYPYLTDLRVYQNVLHVAYVASDGKQVENFFRYNTFLARTGAEKLRVMAERVAAARKDVVTPSIWKPAAVVVPQQPAVRAELAGEKDQWHYAAVYSALVAFPAICPACAVPAETVGRLPLSAGLDEKGNWLVPACRAHADVVAQVLRPSNWRAAQSRLEFACARKDYARCFVAANSGETDAEVRRQRENAPLLYELKNGKRFVVYQYAVSLIAISLLRPSKLEELAPNQSRFVRGLKYSLISLVAGWWGIPAGPIFTIASIVRNCRGGVDVTGTVLHVLSGTAISGGGY